METSVTGIRIFNRKIYNAAVFCDPAARFAHSFNAVPFGIGIPASGKSDPARAFQRSSAVTPVFDFADRQVIGIGFAGIGVRPIWARF